MVIDMNVSRLETIEKIRKFLNGTSEVAFSHPADESTLHTFVSTVLRRYRYFRLSKGQRGVLFANLRGQSNRFPSNQKLHCSEHEDSQRMPLLQCPWILALVAYAARTHYPRGLQAACLLPETSP